MNTRTPVVLILLFVLAAGVSYASTAGARDASQPASASPDAIVTLHFDEYADGTRIADQYAAQGVHFINDYYPDVTFRTSPMIKTHSTAKSAPNVLVNSYYDAEFYNSTNIPMLVWFDQPVAGVGMWLGTKQMSQMFTCDGSYTAKVTVSDCNGSFLSEKTVTVSSAFNTPLEIDDALGRISLVKIDYGATPCPEAIDEFAFQTTTNTCSDIYGPKVTITSHAKSSIVNTAKQEIKGTVTDNGIIKSVKINGTPVGFYQSYGIYYFHGFVNLSEGSNTITVLAEDKSSNKGSDQVVITLNTPSSASIAQFHLTQRGVVFNKSCDIDKPLVAGKSALVRLDLSVKSSTGGDTYASQVDMKLYRKSGASDILVDTIQGTMYSPFLSQFNSASDMSAVHFWVPAADLDPAAEYKFVFQPYVGLTPIGGPLTASCAGNYHQFYDTKPIRLLIVPVEHASNSSVFYGTNHVSLYYQQLDNVLRTYPIRESWSTQLNSQAGLIIQEANPVKWCNGVTTDPIYCKGTGWTWTFIDHDASGTLRRADHAEVLDLTNTTICGGGTEKRHQTIGGRIISTNTFTHSFSPAIGIIRGGAHPEWEGAKYVNLFDEDHDGDIDAVDRQKFIAEFFDVQTNQWSTNLNLYEDGETFRFFVDQDGDHCNDDNETQAPVRELFKNEGSMIDNAAFKSLEKVNQNIPGTSQDFVHTSVWFADVLAPPEEYRSFGPGQGRMPGVDTWIRVMNIVAMAHELGHNLSLDDLYYDTISDDLKTVENPWVVYIKGKAREPKDIFEVMSFSRAFDDVLFGHSDYSTLFYKVLKGSSSAPEASEIGASFILSALLKIDDTLESVVIGTSSSMLPTQQDPTSPYALVFGQGTAVLSTFPFAPDAPAPPPEGFDDYPMTYRAIQVVAPLPPATGWVELRKSSQVLARFERSAQAPVVQVTTPNGGESYTASQNVTVQWTTNDPDSSDLLASIFYSPDGGESWLLLAADQRGDSFNWNTTNVPGTNNGRIRVEVSDGFNSGLDQSDGGFTVGGKPPQVAIVQPENGQVYLQCARPRVRGIAVDPEGALAHKQWWVDATESSTQLEAELRLLSPGLHTLSLRAVDADGMQSNTSIQITVLPDADCDSMPDEYEAAYGLDPGYAQDAAWDGDEDGLRNFEEAWYHTSPDAEDSDGDGYPDGEEVILGSDPTVPGETPVRLYLAPAETTLNVNGVATLELRIENVRHLYAFQLELAFNPVLLEVVDAKPGVPGVQIQDGEFFTPDISLKNIVNNTTGKIEYGASLQGVKPGVNGSGVLARLTLKGKSAGLSQVNITRAILSDPASIQIPSTQSGALVTVQQSSGNLSGKIILERRTSSAGASLCLGGTCATTAANGDYLFTNLATGDYLAAASHPGYLRSQRAFTLVTGTQTLPDVTLLAGDINRDDRIELADAELVALAWNTTPASPNWNAAADLTADGQINVLDMVAVQYNWDALAPGPWGTGMQPASPALAPQASDPSTAAQVRLVASRNGPLVIGDRVEIEVLADGLVDLYSYRLQISYDPTILRLVDADLDTPGVQTGASELFAAEESYALVNRGDQPGWIDYAITLLAPAQGQNGAGALARLTFEAIGNGWSPVELLQARLLDSSLPEPVVMPLAWQPLEVQVGDVVRLYLPLIQR
jgi:hypothetical protein